MATAGTFFTPSASPVRFDFDVKDDSDNGLSIFASLRPRLFGIAHRMLGTVAEAEDVVQDVWLRWQFANREAVDNPPAFLAITTTRMCINLLQSAHSRRETYVGKWLPEPADTSSDPASGAEREEALRHAVQLLLERLFPAERAAYILREAFDYSYRRIAEVLQMEEATTRQLVCRARKHIAEGPRTSVTPATQQRLLQGFIAAAQKGETAALESLLADDVSLAWTAAVTSTHLDHVDGEPFEAERKPHEEFANLTLADVINDWNSFDIAFSAAPVA